MIIAAVVVKSDLQPHHIEKEGKGDELSRWWLLLSPYTFLGNHFREDVHDSV